MEELLKKEAQLQECLTCGSELTGRAGKKFCSDQCRAQYNNRKKTTEERWIQQLNRILRKNRTVLRTLNPKGHSTVRQEVLLQMGFDRGGGPLPLLHPPVQNRKRRYLLLLL
jgi:predicted nucleic acid-binding Zn ribbon protein